MTYLARRTAAILCACVAVAACDDGNSPTAAPLRGAGDVRFENSGGWTIGSGGRTDTTTSEAGGAIGSGNRSPVVIEAGMRSGQREVSEDGSGKRLPARY
jgi:hypothetical protein